MSLESLNNFEEKVTPLATSIGEMKDRVSDMASKVKDRVGNVAGAMSEKVSQVRESAAGGLGRAATTTHDIADGMQSTSSYLKDHDFSQIGTDAMNICRRYPTQSLIVAAALGFLIGRVRR